MYTTNSRFLLAQANGFGWFRFDRTFAILIQVVLHKDTVLNCSMAAMDWRTIPRKDMVLMASIIVNNG